MFASPHGEFRDAVLSFVGELRCRCHRHFLNVRAARISNG
jgi:hypothetical protein